MKIMSMIKYRLHRYFYSSRPILPLLGVLCFIRVMYSVKPAYICSGYIVSGVFQFCLLIFVALSVNGNEGEAEEQLLLLHGKSKAGYYLARELSLFIISCVYGGLLIFGPVITNCFNHFTFFLRPLTTYDVAMGALIILGSGFAGIAVGDMLHPRIMSDRKLAVVLTVGIMILSIVKDAIIDEYRVFRFFGILFPSVMKPARDLGNGDYFNLKSVMVFGFMIALYYLVVTIIKNLVMNRRKFS